MTAKSEEHRAGSFALSESGSGGDGTGNRDAAGTIRGVGIKVHFGGVKAVDGVDLVLHQGEILGLIGPNGAGKTTLVNALTGVGRLSEGRVTVEGRDVSHWSPERLVRIGVTRTFQGARLYPKLTVLENVEVAGLAVGYSRREARTRALGLLDRIGLVERSHREARSLPYGEGRLLSIARALAARPKFLLLDEPAAGLGDKDTDTLLANIATIRDDFDCGILVIEHDMRLIMRLSERIQVLDHGKTLAVGSPTEIRTNPDVIEAYLGKKHADQRTQPGA